LQAALPFALFCGRAVHMRITGGTDVNAAPPVDYFLHVFLSLLTATGAKVRAWVLRRGYDPHGGSIVDVNVSPMRALRPLRIEIPEPLQNLTAHATSPICPGMSSIACARRQLHGSGRQDALRVDAQVVGFDEGVGRGAG
jgi:RNA 3'-terminal phosphate cyclase (ATP)